jgi:ABC-type multidrug transport system fused ATPase/permease subunit
MVAPKYLIMLIIIALVGAVLPILPLFFMERVLNILVDRSGEIKDYYWLVVLLLMGGLVNFLGNFTSGLRTYLSNFAVGIVEKHINVSIVEIASSTDLRYVDSKDYFVTLDNVRRSLGRRWDNLVLAPVNLLAHIITLTGLFLILGSYHSWVCLLVVIGITPNVLVQIKSRGMMNDFYEQQLEENRKINYLENLLTDRKNAGELRLFQMNQPYIHMFENLLDIRHKKVNQLRKRELMLTSLASVLSFATIAVCQVIIAYDVFMKYLLLGQWQLYTGTISSISFNLGVLFNIIANSYEEELFSNVLNDFTNKTVTVDVLKGEPLKRIPNVIELVDVGFCYPDCDDFVLRHINLTIKKGEKIAVVGLNGAGKTTLIKLIIHLYKPTEGKILFDGVDTSTYALKDIYQLFGIVFQDHSRYAFTLKENIAISDMKNINDQERLRLAMQKSGVDQFAAALPKGFDTYLTKDFDKDGIGGLSGGQWQKVAIARGFFNDAPIVVFDEPASNLDPVAEYEVYQKLIILSEEKTTIVISHRLSSARMSDKIILLDKGTVVEFGSHEELMKCEKQYAHLFQLQAKQYTQEAASD